MATTNSPQPNVLDQDLFGECAYIMLILFFASCLNMLIYGSIDIMIVLFVADCMLVSKCKIKSWV